MNVGLAYNRFYGSFKQFYPKLEIVNPEKDIKKYDLIIFSGGEDINPSIYSKKNTHSYGIDPIRDEVEQRILHRALNSDKKIKILGVCRGHQLINAFLGGRLVQDIFTEMSKPHSSPHNLEITYENSITEFILQGRKVNSLHHQGVINKGSGLLTTSVHRGVIESTESAQIFSVQWHPEFMADSRFFDVVNKWVTSRDKLISEIKSNPTKPPKKEKIDFEYYTLTSTSTSIPIRELRTFIQPLEVEEEEEEVFIDDDDIDWDE